jgi:lipoprotein-releasing system permease protein
MALGLIPLVVVFSIADGMIEGIMARTIEAATYHVQLWPVANFPPPDRAEKASIRKKLDEALPGTRAWPERDGFALAYSAEGRLGVSLRGIDPSWIQDDPGVRRYLKAEAGTLAFPDAHSVWLGHEAAQKLGLKVGGRVKILTAQLTGQRLGIPRVTTFTVRALVGIGYQELDKLWVFLPYATAVQILPGPQTPTFWGVKVPNPYNHIDQKAEILGQAVGGGYVSAPWTQIARSQTLNFQATRALLGIITALILLVASVNVSTAMVTLVLERRREIAILKATGTRPRVISAQFSFLGVASGFLAALIGLGAGTLISLGLNGAISLIDTVATWFLHPSDGHFRLLSKSYYLDTIPVKIHPETLVILGLGTVLLAFFASWWPAHRAAKLRPLDVLRKI